MMSVLIAMNTKSSRFNQNFGGYNKDHM